MGWLGHSYPSLLEVGASRPFKQTHTILLKSSFCRIHSLISTPPFDGSWRHTWAIDFVRFMPIHAIQGFSSNGLGMRPIPFGKTPIYPFLSTAEEKASIQMKGLGRILLSMEEKASCNFLKPRLLFLSKMAFISFTNSGEASHSAYSPKARGKIQAADRTTAEIYSTPETWTVRKHTPTPVTPTAAFERVEAPSLASIPCFTPSSKSGNADIYPICHLVQW